MEDIVYKDMIKQEKEHWWFKARREILDKIIKDLNLPKDIDILEVGCGTGGNLNMLNSYGKVIAMEMDDFAVKYAQSSNVEIKQGYLPEKFPYDEKFDLICMFDVLEHIEDDVASLKVIKQYLKPSGIILLTVPSYQWLFGSHDKLLHHKRRYNKSILTQKIKNTPFHIVRISYFNTLLFPLVVLARFIDIIKKPNKSIGYEIPNKIINFLFFTIFKSEKRLLDISNFPFGTSLFVIAKHDELL